MTSSETLAKGMVVQAVRAAFEKSGKTIKQIAGEAGVGSERSWPMMLDGRCKVPMTWIVPLCKVTGADPAHLLRVMLTEYYPFMIELLETLGPPLPLTANERRLIESLRAITNGTDAQVVVADGRDLVAVVMV